MDKISPELRSRNMSLIRSKNTKPELLIRKLLFRLGYRYRIHYPLPGKPDIVFPKKKIAIFIHGCYWHGHGCKIDHVSKSNSEFWSDKIRRNKERDFKIIKILKKSDWRVGVIWECEIKKELVHATSKLLTIIDGNN